MVLCSVGLGLQYSNARLDGTPGSPRLCDICAETMLLLFTRGGAPPFGASAKVVNDVLVQLLFKC